ncbi:hypothetical protein ASE16_12800 [Leifsonia sp. Root227]|nr:hypothetical protein ASE16_12800 [Leifsonia sp. Root227]
MWMRATGLSMAAAAAALVLASLTGCTHSSDTAKTSAPASPTRPAPQKTASAVPVDPANVSAWLVTWAGMGPLTIGGDVTAQTAAIPGFAKTIDEDGCVGYELEPKQTGATPDGAQPTVTTVARDGSATTAVRIRVADASGLDQAVSPTPKTSAGIGLGSTLDALQKAYPDLERSNSVSGGQRAYALGDGNGRFVDFVVNGDDVVTAIVVGGDDRVSSDLCD